MNGYIGDLGCVESQRRGGPLERRCEVCAAVVIQDSGKEGIGKKEPVIPIGAAAALPPRTKWHLGAEADEIAAGNGRRHRK